MRICFLACLTGHQQAVLDTLLISAADGYFAVDDLYFTRQRRLLKLRNLFLPGSSAYIGNMTYRDYLPRRPMRLFLHHLLS